MTELLLIWELSLLLAGTALAMMIALMIARVVTQRRDEKRRRHGRQLAHNLMRGAPLSAQELKALPRNLVAETFLDLIRLVRGDERASFVAQAQQLGVAEHLGRLTRSASARRRLVAVQSLAQFHDEESLRRLHASLEDHNQDVRLAAALSLAEAGEADDIHALIGRLGLGDGQDSMMMVTLFRIIAEDRPDEIKALVLDDRTNRQARLAAIEALATTGDYSLVPAIARLALDAPDDSEELPRYLRALGLLGHPAARDAILDGLQRRSVSARAAAAAAAGKIGLEEAADRLTALLDDREWWVRFRAAEALMAFGKSGATRLREAACLGSIVARDAAATVLAERGEAR
ncbi:HEAT repeat domain-containing protein [Allosphingosinicella indica]|uniref:HEAT repeat n=1 Tax=Allosphingosinicella indica TaxID=941907 RepID=A0A1X7FYL8_9SPHN|nr:HEAT repeat domain-containing protein [Allosphingosinicella indica]SMF61192.1 HEAT repeat [Allosphingosinicella indica]